MSSPARFTIGGALDVRRLGFGAMRICGEGVWGPPPDVAKAKALLHRVLELGIDFIDTADAYGPETSENLLREALHPYPKGVVIATKGGLLRPAAGVWKTCGTPKHLRTACEGSLKRLGVDCIELYQLHAPDDDVPFADSVGTLAELQKEGKIRHVGLSNVSVVELEEARALVKVVTVQNRYNLADRQHEPVMQACTKHGIGFIPWYPLATGALTQAGSPASAIAEEVGATASQVALSWLLHKSEAMLPIPGTSSQKHLEENLRAEDVELSAEQMAALD